MSTPTHKKATDYKIGDRVDWQGIGLTKKTDVIPFIECVQSETVEQWETVNGSLLGPTLSFIEGNSLPDFFPLD